MNKYNVLLLTIDTLRTDKLGCYSHPAPPTPNINRLATSGILFKQAITCGSWTQAAFPAILTSSYASMYGGCLGRLAPERPSPIETLARNGYITGGFSTNPHLSKATGYDRGFHHFIDLVPDQEDPSLRRFRGGQRILRNPLTHYMLWPLGNRMRPVKPYTSASEVTETARQWLDTVEPPFFGWIHYMDLHWPNHIKETLTTPRDVARAWQDLGIMHRRSNFKREQPLNLSQINRFIRLYELALQELDIHIGKLLDHLEKLGYGSETIILLTSDHGEEFLDHGRWGHKESNLFDEIIKVPLIIKHPGWTDGMIIQNQVRLLDIMPTILDLCDCPPSNNLEGISLVPLWRDNGTQYSILEAISEMPRSDWHRIALRTEDIKYIWDNKHPDQPELYDLISDPGETQNIGTSNQHSSVISRFETIINQHLERIANTKPVDSIPALDLDEKMIKRLRDLGYVE